MPNIAAVIKAEIARLSEKEAKSATSQLKRASVQYRSDIAKLKRLLGQQEREIKLLKRQTQQPGRIQAEQEPLEGVRFPARSVKAQRQRLGLSAADYGRLIGVSGLTVYNWEHGATTPRQAQLAALVAVRGIGERGAPKVGGIAAQAEKWTSGLTCRRANFANCCGNNGLECFRSGRFEQVGDCPDFRPTKMGLSLGESGSYCWTTAKSDCHHVHCHGIP